MRVGVHDSDVTAAHVKNYCRTTAMPTTVRNENIEDNEFLTDLYPPHPGLLLKIERLPHRKVTGTGLAQAIGATQPSIAKVLNGKGPVTHRLAARVEAAIGYPAAILCRLQTAYDLAQVRRENREGLDAIPKFAAWREQRYLPPFIVSPDGNE